MPYWRLFYHLVWATRERQPWLTPDIEPVVHDYLRAKAAHLGATVFALNGVADHVHVVAAIPPKVSVAHFAGQLKGASSARLNKACLLGHTFAWQAEYGVLSFDEKRLPKYVGYVEKQKEHHAQNRTIPALERRYPPLEPSRRPARG